MTFYDPMQAGPDIGGGLSELINMFMMFQLIQGMYPDEKGKKKGRGKEMDISDIGNILMPETPLPPTQEMPPELPMGQMGQSQIGQPQMGQAPQQPQLESIQQMLQMLGGIPGLMR